MKTAEELVDARCNLAVSTSWFLHLQAADPLPPAVTTSCAAFAAAAACGSAPAANQAPVATASQRVLRACSSVQPQLKPVQAPAAGSEAAAGALGSADDMQQQAAIPAALIVSVQASSRMSMPPIVVL